MRSKKAVPRRERMFPTVYSTKWPTPLLEKEGCFIPLEQYRELEQKYYKMFKKYRKALTT